MKRLPTRLDGLILMEPAVHADERGFFLETFHAERYRELGIDVEFVQDNHSRSRAGVVRALHFQADPGQPKLVRVAWGAAFDVVVDLRRSSSTFGQWEAFELDDELHHQLFVPIGFAHGFCARSETVDVVYKVGSLYDPAMERGLAWDDPRIGIPWPCPNPVVSDRDRRNPTLDTLMSDLPAW